MSSSMISWRRTLKSWRDIVGTDMLRETVGGKSAHGEADVCKRYQGYSRCGKFPHDNRPEVASEPIHPDCSVLAADQSSL
jgi:hypothetical protein